MTLEEAEAEIVRLNEELATANTEREHLTSQRDDLTRELEKVRGINLQYFLKLQAQYNPATASPATDTDEEVPSCEDFAKTLTI